ncbi:MAG: hypothetical protein KIT58_10795 [Planctomycetota bacterium]|nr:hypothetical protein [Planctomycetota bacterium]
MTCPFCAEAIDPAATRCPHCGERLTDPDDLAASLRDVRPDEALAARLGEWPDESLVRALRDHTDLYERDQQRAILDELGRRGLPTPVPRRASRSVLDRFVTTAAACVLLAFAALLVLGLLLG